MPEIILLTFEKIDVFFCLCLSFESKLAKLKSKEVNKYPKKQTMVKT